MSNQFKKTVSLFMVVVLIFGRARIGFASPSDFLGDDGGVLGGVTPPAVVVTPAAVYVPPPPFFEDETSPAALMVMVMAAAAALPDVTAQISALGLNVSRSGDDIFVSGTASVVAPVTLDISGLTVHWSAALSGSVDRARYILTLTGSGTFNLDGTINNSAGGALSVNGADAAVNIMNGGALHSSSTGITLYVNADGVTVNVLAGGLVNNAGTKSAVNVREGSTGVSINVSGGAVTSVPNGYAINDNGVSTVIKIQNGAVITAALACAIRSEGAYSSVTVANSTVTNAASNNANPAIFMNAGAGDNVLIEGASLVQTTSRLGYAIQTTGNVKVTDTARVTSIDGRSINLIGMTSLATISGNAGVSASGTGHAISTATTTIENVAQAGVLVTGGTVSSYGGNAVNVTGANSHVEITGGTVSSVSGRAVSAEGGNSDILISGGIVYSFRTTGTGRTVNAPASARVKVTNGLVFAYGNAGDQILFPRVGANLAGYGYVVAWSRARFNYNEGTHDDLINYSPMSAGFTWHRHPTLGGGISFVGSGIPSWFLPISEVTVGENFSFIFDAAAGKVYRDYNGNGVIDYADSEIISAPGIYSWSAGNITLRNFSWTTGFPHTFTIINGSANVTLEGNNRIVTTDSSSSTIKANAGSFNLKGDGTLEIIGYGSVFNSEPGLPDEYLFWTNTQPQPVPNDMGTIVYPGSGTDYLHESAHQYFKISLGAAATVETVKGQPIYGTMRTTLPQQAATITLHGVTLLSMGATDASSWFGNIPAGVTVTAEGADGGKKINLTFGGMPIEESYAIFEITIPAAIHNGGADITVMHNPAAKFEIGPFIQLIAGADIGGSISGASKFNNAEKSIAKTASFLEVFDAGTEITLTASAIPGFQFVAWDAVGLEQLSLESSSISFLMPPGTVVLFARFAPVLEVNVSSGGEVQLVNDGSGITVADSWTGVSPIDAEVTAEAVGHEGFSFVGWEAVGLEDNPPSLTEPKLKFIMPANKVVLSAKFEGPAPGAGTPPSREPLPPAVTAPAHESDGEQEEWEQRYRGRAPAAPRLTRTHHPHHDEMLEAAAPQTVPLSYVSHALNTAEHIVFVRGVGNNRFEPDRFITRAEAAQIFYNLLLQPHMAFVETYHDVDNAAWYSDAVSALTAIGNITGYPDGYFRPDNSITRAEFAAIAVLFTHEYSRVLLAVFPDVAESHWAYDYINAAANFNWIVGYPNGRFEPDRNISRAEAVSIVNRMLNRRADREFVDAHLGGVLFSDVPAGHWAFYEIMEAANFHWYVDGVGGEEWGR